MTTQEAQAIINNWKGSPDDPKYLEAYYKSKYKEPESDFPSDSNQRFAKEMGEIFK